MFLHVHNHQTWTQIVTLPTLPHKVKNQPIKWHKRLCNQYYKIKNMLGNVNRLYQFWHVHTIFFDCTKNHVAYIKTCWT